MSICVVRFTGGRKVSGLPFAVIYLVFICLASNSFADAGLDEFNVGNYQKALEIWGNQLIEKPDSAELNYNLAMLFDKGLGIEADESQAKKYYLRAANKNYAPAMFKLGVLMAKTNDYQQAAKWWLKASSSDLPEVQYNLAKLYRDGQGVEKDLYKAKFWFKKSAESAMKKYNSLNYRLLESSNS